MPASSPQAAAESLRILQARWQRDWRFFYYQTLGGPPLTWDQEALWDHVAAHERTVVTSGHATGKDFEIGRIVPWFLFSWSPAIVITTAPTDRQVEKIIWGEIHAAEAKARIPLGGKLLEKEWVVDAKNKYYAIGFTSKDTQASSQHFQGFHQAHVLVVLSEAPGVHDSVWEALEGLTTAQHVRVLAVGQAIGSVGAFYEVWRHACRRGPQCRCAEWHHLALSSWDAAAWNEQIGIPGLATRAWCERRLLKWGEDSPLYVSRVLGQMPEGAGDRIIALAWAALAQELELPTGGACGMGIDPAWRGEDASAFCVVRGQRQTRLEVAYGQNTLEVVNRAVRIIREEQEAHPEQPLKTVCVDLGYNPGVYDQLWSVSEELGFTVIGVNFGGTAEREAEYYDKGAEMWWTLREALRVGTFQLLPQDHQESDELLNELTARRLSKKPDKLGRIRLESKDELKKRGAHSPDRVDALILAREACRQLTSPMLSSTAAEPEPSEDEAAVWTPA